MAIYHLTTRIISSGKGKSAVASSAYLSAQKLHSDKYGLSFNYTRKEEVVFSEVLLPRYAPEEFGDREVLWNAVEKYENKINSRYAREFEFAIPNEWNRDEAITRSREYIQTNFVDKGMIADWAYHEKEGNHHVHCMCTLRAFNKDGTWSKMRKSEFALDENGNRIPILDESGNQKVRKRKGKGEEKLWKRIDVVNNQWNSKEQLIEWRKKWADFCNQYLDEENQIDHRSFEERGLELMPTIHEGYAARQMEENGKVSDRCQHNRKVKEANNLIIKIQKEIKELTGLMIEKARELYGRTRRITENRSNARGTGEAGADVGGIGFRESTADRAGEFIRRTEQSIVETNRDIEETESAIDRIKRKITEVGGSIDERYRRLRNSRDSRLHGANGTGVIAEESTDRSIESKDTESILREIKAARRIAERVISDSEASRDDKVTERKNREDERERSSIEESRKVLRRSR